MTSIGASTMHKMKAPSTQTKSVKTTTSSKTIKKASPTSTVTGSTKRGLAPKLVPNRTESDVSGKSEDELRELIDVTLSRMLGQPTLFHRGGASVSKPRTASTTADRSIAAANLAVIGQQIGIVRLLKSFNVLSAIERQLIPLGIGAVFGNESGTNPGGGMRKIASAVSLASMTSMDTSVGSAATDSKKGKTTNAEAREGCLVFLRALAHFVGKQSEPFIIPLLAAALDESSSSNSFVRDAAEDTATALIALANPHAVPTLICPVLFEALHSPEWRVKHNALDRLAQCSKAAPNQISNLLPNIVPIVTSQLWDTKPQVNKAAAASLLSCCQTNQNPDVSPAIPAVVAAIIKPSETIKAIDELKATTFVASVDASTLSILCPVLSRGLKDKLALNKRSCCVVIENMSRLVDSPDAVAPFGPLLVPDLKKVVDNVQFEEIRDAALAALLALTKALGHSSIDDAIASMMKEEAERIATEQARLEAERAEEVQREQDLQRREEEERRLWKEAMEAQRLLDKLALEEDEEKKAEDRKAKEMMKKSTKSEEGKCQGCGLKRCKKSCLFNN